MNAKKLLACIIVSIAAAIVLIPTMAFAEGGDEWGKVPATTTAIALDQEMEVNAAEGDFASFKFVPTAPGNYVFESFSTDQCDPRGCLIGPGERDVIENDDGGTGDNFLIAFTVTEDNVNKPYYLQCSGVEFTAAVYKVTLKNNPIKSITFTRGSNTPIKLYQGHDGDFTNKIDEYVFYSLDADDFGVGDKLSVTMEGRDSTIDYVLTSDEEPYFSNNEYGSINIDRDIKWLNQDTNNWTPGEHVLTGSWSGVSFTVPVTIEPGLGTVPAEAEGLDTIKVNDKKTVSTDNLQVKTFKFIPETSGTYVFASQGLTIDGNYDEDADPMGCVIKPDGSKVVNDDGGDHENFLIRFEATAGETYYLQCAGYLMEDANFIATLENSQIKAINFTPAAGKSGVELIDEEDGYFDDSTPGATFFMYELEGYDYHYNNGDTLTVTKPDDTQINYIFNYKEERFINAADETDVIKPYDFEVSSDQSKDNPWTIGGTGYHFSATYQGAPFEIPITIIPGWGTDPSAISDLETIEVDNIKNIETDTHQLKVFKFSPQKDGTYIFYARDNEYTDEEGEPGIYDTYGSVVELTGSDGNTKKSVVKNDDSAGNSNFQIRFDAKAGKDYYLKCGGSRLSPATFKVSLVEDTIKSIVFSGPNNSVMELLDNIDGAYDEDEEKFIYKPKYESGCTLTVNTTTDEVLVYTYDTSKGFVHGEDVISPDAFRILSDQYEGREWKANENHVFECSYLGEEFEINVTIIASLQTAINKINAIPATVTLADEPTIVAAREAYDKLSADQKAQVSAALRNKLTSAEAKIKELKETAKNDQAAADRVIKAINSLPSASALKVTDEAAVNAARAAYNALTADQKKLVTNLSKLTDAENTINRLKATAVTTAINALPSNVTLTNEAAVTAARSAYDALTADQKKLVTTATLKKLTDAETAIEKLNKAASDPVAAMINALPADLSLTDEEAIAAARKAYDALSASQKAQIPAATLAKLTNAETTLTNLKEFDSASADAEALTTKVVKVKNKKGKKAVVVWKKVSGNTGYQIRYSTNKKFKKGVKTKTIKKATAKKTLLKKLKPGKTYYIQARTYTTILNAATNENVTVYSKWSKSKRVKILK